MLGEEDVDAASISENGSARELVLGRGASSEPGANSVSSMERSSSLLSEL